MWSWGRTVRGSGRGDGQLVCGGLDVVNACAALVYLLENRVDSRRKIANLYACSDCVLGVCFNSAIVRSAPLHMTRVHSASG